MKTVSLLASQLEAREARLTAEFEQNMREILQRVERLEEIVRQWSGTSPRSAN